MRTFLKEKKFTLISLAVIVAVFCAAALIALTCNSLAPEGLLHF